jgi:ribosome recycling factor
VRSAASISVRWFASDLSDGTPGPFTWAILMDDDLVGLVVDETREKMAKAIEHVRSEMGNVRTGRASSALLEPLVVDYYGTPTPLRQLAGFSVPDAMLLVITPYDKGSLADIERAIKGSDLGINPTNDGNVIRLAFPSLTEERRKELVKVVRHKAEEGKVAVRNLRRDGRKDLEALQKDGSLSTDELERVEKDVEKMTHEQVGTIDRLLSQKEQELLQV